MAFHCTFLPRSLSEIPPLVCTVCYCPINCPFQHFPCLSSSSLCTFLKFYFRSNSHSFHFSLGVGLAGKAAGTSAKDGVKSCGMLKLDLDLQTPSRGDMVGGVGQLIFSDG